MRNKGKNTKLNEIRKGFWGKSFQPLKINTMRLSFLFLLLLSITCKGQPVEREKFDFELYKKYGKDSEVLSLTYETMCGFFSFGEYSKEERKDFINWYESL